MRLEPTPSFFSLCRFGTSREANGLLGEASVNVIHYFFVFEEGHGFQVCDFVWPFIFWSCIDDGIWR